MSTVDGSEPCLVGSCGRKLLGDLCPAHNDDKLCLGGATGVLPLTTCAACFLWVHHPHCVRKGETRLRPRKEATHAVLAQCSSRQSVLRGVAGREPLLCCCGPLVFFFFFFSFLQSRWRERRILGRPLSAASFKQRGQAGRWLSLLSLVRCYRLSNDSIRIFICGGIALGYLGS